MILAKLPEADTAAIAEVNQFFWNDNAPQIIIIASASVRKEIQIATSLIGFKASRNMPFMELSHDPASAQTPLDINQIRLQFSMCKVNISRDG